MADTTVSLAIDKLIVLLTQEVNLLIGVHREVAELKDELESIRSFLKDANSRLEKENVSSSVKTWVKQVREVAYRIEDVIDEYMLCMAKRRDQRGFKAFLHTIACLVKTVRPRHEITSKIQDIKRSIREIKERSQRYSFNSLELGGSSSNVETNHTWNDPRVGSLFLKEDELVGIEFAKNELVSKLVNGASQHTVVSMGDVEHALLDNNKSSRVMIKSKIKDVAEFYKKSSLLYVHQLDPLPIEEAQKLLCRKAFQFDVERQCSPTLEKLSFKIVKRCKGLPLAVVAIGGLLSTRGKDLSQWQNLLDSLIVELDCNPHLINIKRILSFNYLELPSHLKPCFLYLGMFSEDCPINCAKLVWLWMEKGFVKEKHGITLKKVIEGYLTELIHRNLVQVVGHFFDGKVRYCGVHDLVREVILSRSEELNLRLASVENYTSHDGKARHLSICDEASCVSKITSNAQTRSIIFYRVDNLPNPLFNTVFANLKLLRVLDSEGSFLQDIRIKMLPKFIGKLLNLETLDLKRSLVHELLDEINRLHRLQYLLAYSVNYDGELSVDTRQGVKIQNGIRCLNGLQKLSSLDVEHSKVAIKELARWKQLRKLGINKLKAEDGKILCVALKEMDYLQSLSITLVNEVEPLELHSLSSLPPSIQRLLLKGKLENLLHWISKLKSLSRVSLFWSKLLEDPLKVLELLPNLLDLWLYGGYDGDQLHFKEGHFEKLKVLGLRCLNGLTTLEIEKGALPSFQGLAIGGSPQLKEVPCGISCMDNLKSLEFWDMPIEFKERTLPTKGQDHWKVNHIPNVFFIYSRGIMSKSYKLSDFELVTM
ncbi:PREDICTED: disease resistance protein RPM1 [Theobroma cacao]|uniref:Disease resistance protein RPM1 n=1 Tax=Theobroma cacao TaxID=3641 RepID=A0AB32WXF5_THECC|nr:PREDICTED: disease resistance protein RPM1 [Theobroma cacao]